MLATKFALPPEQAAFVRRERLFACLDRGVERPLTLLAAPPGAGKTALLASWIAAERPPGPVAWLSLDPADGDRRRFWRAVFEALSRAGLGTRVASLAAHPEERVDVLVAALASALAERHARRWCSSWTTSTRSPTRSTGTSSCCSATRCRRCG